MQDQIKIGASKAPNVGMMQSKVCEHCQPLRHETNVLVLARLNVLHRLADINLVLALACIIYFAVSVVLFMVTVWPTQHLVDPDTFHHIDFGSNFLFSNIEVLILVYSPERRFTSPTLLRMLMFYSVCSTFVSWLLVVLNRSAFEVVSHNIDYLNDFVVALIDSILVKTVLRSPANHPGRGAATSMQPCRAFETPIAACATFFPLLLSFGQVAIYNGFGVGDHGQMLGERPSHVLEFIFDAVGAAISFWFCLDSKKMVEELARQIMLAPDDLVVVIDPTSHTSVHTAEETGRSPFARKNHGPPLSFHDHVHDHVHEHHVCDDTCGHDHGPMLRSDPSRLTEHLLPPSIS